MESLKKIISLNQAAKISGYTQDYLGYLIRQGEMKGIKKGRTWFTTEEELQNYIFKKKVRSQKFAVKEFFSPSRTRNIIVAVIVVFISGLFILSSYNRLTPVPAEEIKSAEMSDGEGIRFN